MALIGWTSWVNCEWMFDSGVIAELTPVLVWLYTVTIDFSTMFPYFKKCISRWWFQIFFMFIPTWGNDPIWLIFFKWVETTNQISHHLKTYPGGLYKCDDIVDFWPWPDGEDSVCTFSPSVSSAVHPWNICTHGCIGTSCFDMRRMYESVHDSVRES